MRKKLGLIITAFALLACVFSLASCGKIVFTEHDYGSWVEGTEATCNDFGTVGHYQCSCHDKYFDEDKKEISSIAIEDGEYGPHSFVGNSCKVCGYTFIASNGLSFALSDDEEYYILTGIGTCTDTEIIIPPVYENLPVEAIKASAFRRNSSIKSVTVASSVITIGESAFSDCEKLASVVFEEGSRLEKIEASAFEYCQSLTSVTIPDSVEVIGDYALRNCASLTSVNVPENVTTIGYEAFLNCPKLSAIEVDEGNENYKDIDGNLYTKDGKTLILYATGKTIINFVIPDGVKTIGPSAFESSHGIRIVVIPDSVTKIEVRAFDNCQGLTSVTIGNNVGTIGDYAFEFCPKLESIIIPDSVYEIGYRAFDGCTGLTSLTIPAGVNKIGDYAFSLCTGLTGITVEKDNPNYKDINGDLYSKDGRELIQYATGKTAESFAIPEGVTSICRWVFSGCTSLTSVTIPSTVTIIGDYAFENCLALTSIVIPDNVTRIGDYSFSSCDALTTVTLPKSVTSFGNYAFLGCKSLKTIRYRGSKNEWGAIVKGYEWDAETGAYKLSYNYTG